MTAAVAVERLSFAYAKDGRPAVTGLDLEVAPGEVVSVVGPSGSGKSTLLRLVNGLLRPASGSIRVGGQDVTRASPEKRPVAMVFQGFALFPHLDVAANIGFGLAVRGASRDEQRSRVAAVADRLQLTALLRRTPSQLSGGEQQRVALARALLRDPVVFCLDEPLSALDPVLRAAARRDLEDLLRADGRCALHVTHDQGEAMTLGDRVAVLREGRLEQVGTPRELYERPATTFVAAFVGAHPMSLLPGPVVNASAATVGVRAEHVRLVDGDDAVVTAVDDLGHEQLVELSLGGQRLRALDPTPVRRGDAVGVRIEQWTAFGSDGRRTS